MPAATHQFVLRICFVGSGEVVVLFEPSANQLEGAIKIIL
jgi:hypothetical protein